MDKLEKKRDSAMLDRELGEKEGGNGEDKEMLEKPRVPKLSELAKAMGAKSVEVIPTGAASPTPPAPPKSPQAQEAMKQRLAALIDGKIPPPNEFVKYLVERLRSGNEEFRVVQQNIQQQNQRLGELQKRAIQLQGEQGKYVQDITAWWDRITEKKTEGDTKPPKEETDE
jgi:hypothetical protein